MHQNDSNICFRWVRDIGTRKEQHGNTATPLEGLIKCIVLFHPQSDQKNKRKRLQFKQVAVMYHAHRFTV